MKKQLQKMLLFLMCLPATIIQAQNVAINTTAAAADGSAILDISSLSKGLLIPRMTTSTIASLSNPAKGLLVYDSVKNQLMVNMGSPAVHNWQTIVFNSGWNLTGNSSINAANNFIGTTDAQPLFFRVNNVSSGFMHPSNGNTAFGIGTLSQNTTGVYNTAFGIQALFSNTTGSYNSAGSGFSLLSNTGGSNNTAQGFYSLYSNTTGSANTAMGEETLFSNNTGNNNTANGYAALTANTSGHDNIATGYQALYLNTTGNENVANGYKALYSNISGRDNVANGYDALYDNTGSNNVANGQAALLNNTSGNFNTAEGNESLAINVTGFGNTGLGAETAVAAGNFNNATAIGYSASVDASNKVRVGNTSVTSIGGQVGWSSFSDGRYKQNIKEDVKGLEFIARLRPVTYTIDLPALDTYYFKDKKPDPVEHAKWKQQSIEYAATYRQTGFIAQEVEQVAKQLGFDFSGVDKPQNENSLYGLRYGDFVVPLVKAMQEQQQQIETLKKENAEIKAQLQKLVELISKK